MRSDAYLEEPDMYIKSATNEGTSTTRTFGPVPLSKRLLLRVIVLVLAFPVLLGFPDLEGCCERRAEDENKLDD